MRLKTLAEMLMLVGLISLQIQIWYKPTGLVGLINLKMQQEQMRQAIAKIDRSKEALNKEIAGLKSDINTIEDYMRYELRVIKPSETFFVMPDK